MASFFQDDASPEAFGLSGKDGEDLTFFEICKKILEFSEQSDDADYEINQPQLDKLFAIVAFFIKTAKKYGGSVSPMELQPNRRCGGVTARFITFDIFGKDVQTFCEVMKEVSAFTICSTNDEEICISINVPDVFRKKEHKEKTT